ncbi:hypothetical protein K469DRAFT_691182 [Zopfia rhizophila CBS 207.26]|uniref:Uncharacterized protein n=1 Tax=Zopfia rhizophila CBS 207.26 TaxID=1314779 RepID=A0A6A6EQ06_9PEZI|nr:hypothetical protein K469DRAFT_691182 [Zopfia rhizophila CBS 207.26]
MPPRRAPTSLLDWMEKRRKRAQDSRAIEKLNGQAGELFKPPYQYKPTRVAHKIYQIAQQRWDDHSTIKWRRAEVIFSSEVISTSYNRKRAQRLYSPGRNAVRFQYYCLWKDEKLGRPFGYSPDLQSSSDIEDKGSVKGYIDWRNQHFKEADVQKNSKHLEPTEVNEIRIYINQIHKRALTESSKELCWDRFIEHIKPILASIGRYETNFLHVAGGKFRTKLLQEEDEDGHSPSQVEPGYEPGVALKDPALFGLPVWLRDSHLVNLFLPACLLACCLPTYPNAFSFSSYVDKP